MSQLDYQFTLFKILICIIYFYVANVFITGRFRTSSTCIPENQVTANELRLIHPLNKGVSFRDERLVFMPTLGVPCLVFSTIPYSKTIRNPRYVLKL